ncbi:hypothetical protein [Neisseria musculi]|uniref:hypothetical protein n=1 Tax=Neisseria musculi TaxID=1815583 RepID=UPI00360F9071
MIVKEKSSKRTTVFFVLQVTAVPLPIFWIPQFGSIVLRKIRQVISRHLTLLPMKFLTFRLSWMKAVPAVIAKENAEAVWQGKRSFSVF